MTSFDDGDDVFGVPLFAFSGKTALMLASKNGDDDYVRALLADNANIDVARNDTFDTALMYASKYGHVDCVDTLLAANATVDLTQHTGYTALMLASDRGHFDCVYSLLAANASVDLTQHLGLTALMLAIFGGHDECVRALLDKADVDYENDDGRTALMYASNQGKITCVHALLDKGADANYASRTDRGKTALMFASRKGHVNCVWTLLEANAVVDTKDAFGLTALMLASYHGHIDCVNALLTANAIVDCTPNVAEIRCMTWAIAEYWLDRRTAWTALAFASSKKGHVECVRALLDAGATDKEGVAMKVASTNNRVDILKLLIDAFPPDDFCTAAMQWSIVATCTAVHDDDDIFAQSQAAFLEKLPCFLENLALGSTD